MHNFFDLLPAAVQEEFAAVSTFRKVGQGSMIVRAGERRDTLHQLVQGKVKYCSCDYHGRETVTAYMKDGDWIGLSEIFTGMPAMSDVVALSPLRLRTIGKRDFEALMDRHPVIARQLLRLFSLRFSAIYCLGQDRSALTLKERLLKTLYTLSFDGNRTGDAEIVIRMSQEELGKVMAASRQSLNRLLRELEREGLISLGYGTIRLPGRDRISQRYGYLVGAENPSAHRH